MKALYITNSLSMSGGLERMLSLISSRIAEIYNVEIHILTLNDGHLEPFYPIHPKIKLSSIDVKGNPFAFYASYVRGINQTIERVKPEVILVWDDGLKGLTIPIFAKTKAKIFYYRRVSLLVEMQHDYSWYKQIYTRVKWKIMQQLAKKFEGLVLLTEKTKKEWPGVKNFKIIPNPLNFYPQEKSNLSQKIVIAVGRHAYQKGYDRLLNAWKLVIEKHPDWMLHIYGHSYNKNYLPNLISERNLSKNVLMNDPVKNIHEKYLESSLFALASRYEGFGNVIVEAMACGLPVVSFDCPFGPSEIISNQEDGFLIEDGNIERFAQSIMTLIEDESLRLRMGENAKVNVKRYELDSITAKHYAVFANEITT